MRSRQVCETPRHEGAGCIAHHDAKTDGAGTGLLTNAGRSYPENGCWWGPADMGAAMVVEGRWMGIAPPRLKDRCCGGPGGGRLLNDHRAGVAAELSRKPSSNRLGQPSSVCLEGCE